MSGGMDADLQLPKQAGGRINDSNTYHQENYTLKIKLSSEGAHFSAVAHHCVVSVMKVQFRVALSRQVVKHYGQGETYCYACEIDSADNDIFRCGNEIPRRNFRFEEVDGESYKQGCSEKMRVYVY